MALFQFAWLRRFVRRHTREIPVASADIWKRRLSVAYALIAWNAFGFVAWNVYHGKGDWAAYHNLKSPEELRMTPAQQWAKTLNIKNATVYSISGTNVNRYEINENEDETKTPEEGT